MIVISIIIIIIILFFIYKSDQYKKIDKLISKKDLALSRINGYLIIKKDNILVVCTEINEVTDKEVFKNLEDLKTDFDEIIKEDNLLKELYSSLRSYLIINKNFVGTDKFNESLNIIKHTEVELIAVKTYYNDIASEYNTLISRFPNTIKAKKEGLSYLYEFNVEKDVLFDILKKDEASN